MFRNLKELAVSKIRRPIARHLNNYRGWRTNRKIVVIESDDWGSIGIPSKKVYDKLLEKGFQIDKHPYTKFDSLASHRDMNELFSVLTLYKDKKNNYPVITANSVVANPEFDKIEESLFQEYYYEPFTETLKRYPESSHGRVWNIWNEGISQNLFKPQFHGREHIYIKEWMKALNTLDSQYKAAFEDRVCYLGILKNRDRGSNMRPSLEANHIGEIEGQKSIIREGLDLFEKIFGYRSESFIAPNYIYHPLLNPVLLSEGVEIIQGIKQQAVPRLGKSYHKLIRHYQGEMNDLGQTYLVRNCVFEPSLYPESYENVGECLKGIHNAFFWEKPAVITAHRLNFIGAVHPENRERNLPQLRELLKQITTRWPDVEFMTSAELGNLIRSEKIKNQ